MNIMETTRNHADEATSPPVADAVPAPEIVVPAPTAAPAASQEVEVPPPRPNRKFYAIAIGAVGIIGLIALAYLRRQDIEGLFGKFLPYAQITGSLILWIGILRLKDWAAYKTHRARYSLMAVAVLSTVLAGLNQAHERQESRKRALVIEGLITGIQQVKEQVRTNAADTGKSLKDLSGELKDFKDKVKPDELSGEMFGLRTTMEKVLHPPRATMSFTFTPYLDPVVIGGPIIPVRDITLPLNPDGSVHVRFTFINNSTVLAEVLQVSLMICRGCKFAKEPEGFTRIPGSRETERNYVYGDAPARGGAAELAADIIPPPGASRFDIRLRYRCKTCVLEPDGTEGIINIQRN